MENTIKISKVVIHEKYVNRNDIAILILDSPVNYTMYVRPACLPTPSDDIAAWTTSSKLCSITGWGKLKGGLWGEKPQILQEANVPLAIDQECRRKYGGITKDMICAGVEGGEKGTCQGDSGGPLVCQRKDGRYVLVGITSWGRGCAQTYGIYTEVHEFMPWIRNKLRQHNINI